MEILMNGRVKRVGDRLGEALVKMGRATIPASDPLPPVQKVMVVESKANPPKDVDPEISKVAGKPKRQYKRRDMQAES